MPIRLDPKQHVIHIAPEVTAGTFVAPTAAQYLITSNLKAEPANDSNKFQVDSSCRPIEITSQSKLRTQIDFDAPVIWAAAAPTATANLLNINPILLACGAKAPVAVAAKTVAPIVPAHVRYNMEGDLSAIKTVSVSYRRGCSTAAKQLARSIAGARGSIGFEWEIGKVPMFKVQLVGSYANYAKIASIASDATAQLAMLALPAAASNTGIVTINGKNLCLSKVAFKNLFKVSAAIIEGLCGTGATSKMETDGSIALTFLYPDIASAAEFNPDTYRGGTYPFEFNIKGEGTYAARSLRFSVAGAYVDSVKESTTPDGFLACEMTIQPTTELIIQHF